MSDIQSSTKKIVISNGLRSICYLLFVFLVIVSSVIIRLYNFEKRVIYGPEQARSLLVSWRYLSDRPSLLGQEYFRYTSYGHKLFYGPQFNYSLVPLILLFKGDPLAISAFYSFVNLVTGIFVLLFAYKMFDRMTALFAMGIFLLNSFMIYHSLFIWAYNLLPLIGLLSCYMYYLFRKNEKTQYLLVLGALSGLGFSIQYLYSPIIVFLLLLILFYSRSKVINLAYFLLGLIIGNFPMILFDLKHNFYNTISIARYFLDTIEGKSDAMFNYYYLLPFWPIASILGGVILSKMFKGSKTLVYILLAGYFLSNIFSDRVNLKHSLGMPKGLTTADIVNMASCIKNDNPNNFNVVSLLEFDTQGYILRYPLEAIYKLRPGEVDEYPKADVVYALADVSYDFGTPKVWELQSIYPYETERIYKVNSYGLYKLSKAKR